MADRPGVGNIGRVRKKILIQLNITFICYIMSVLATYQSYNNVYTYEDSFAVSKLAPIIKTNYIFAPIFRLKILRR